MTEDGRVLIAARASEERSADAADVTDIYGRDFTSVSSAQSADELVAAPNCGIAGFAILSLKAW